MSKNGSVWAGSQPTKLLWRLFWEILARSWSWGMESKALEKSIATAVVLAGGVDLLKPSAMAADSSRRAEVVEVV